MRTPKKEHIKKILQPEPSAHVGQRKGISLPAVGAIQAFSGNGAVAQLRLNEIVVEQEGGSKKSKKVDPFEAVNQMIQQYNAGYDSTDYVTRIRQLHDIENELRNQHDPMLLTYKNKALHDLFREKKSLVNYQAQEGEDFEVQGGPKAGFEIEWTNMVWLDIDMAESNDSLRTFVRYLKNKDVANASGTDKKLSVKTAPYKKREVLFRSPHGTWEGQADSTVENKPNLELVTRPLSPEQWKSKEVEEDFKLLAQFQARLEGPGLHYALFSPRELLPEIKMAVPGAYLYQAGTKHFVQMTSASFLSNQDGTPDWWLKGLNWNAFPELRTLITGLDTPLRHSNPKDNFPLLLKTPILNILGRPQTGQGPKYAAWIEAVAKSCGIFGKLQENVAQELVKGTSGHMQLKPADFTWQDYLEALLQGDDKIRTWAATAFPGGSSTEDTDEGEDIGYGQIDDRSLGKNWAVHENRELPNLSIPNILEAGKHWAKETSRTLKLISGLVEQICKSTGWAPEKLDGMDHGVQSIEKLQLIYQIAVDAKGCGYPLPDNLLSFDTGKLRYYQVIISATAGIMQIFPSYTLTTLNRVGGDYEDTATKLSLLHEILKICKEKKHVVYNELAYMFELDGLQEYYKYVKSA